MRVLFVVILVVAAQIAIAYESAVIDGVTWSYYAIDHDSVGIGGNSPNSAISESTQGTLEIPSEINGKTVVAIDPYAFVACRGLTSVMIPSSVKSIGDCAFLHCGGLTLVTIPSSVTRIGNWMFGGCSSLTSVTIPSSVTSIGSYAFNDCSSLTSVMIPSSVTSIGSYAFEGCSGLKSVTIPACVKTIRDTFYRAYSQISEVIITEGVTSIGNEAFLGCSGLKSVTIPGGVRSIGDWAFQDCTALTSLSMPEGVTSIGSGAFNGCSNLTSVSVPSSVMSIGRDAFKDAPFFEDLSDGLVVFGPLLLMCKGECSSEVTIPFGVRVVANGVFSGRSELVSVTIPNSVTNVGDCVFENCKELIEVKGATGVKRMGAHVFKGCKELTSVPALDGVEYLEEHAFDGCERLSVVAIPANVKRIGPYAFYGCRGLNELTIAPGVESIGSNAFNRCSGLRSVEVPTSVTFIGEGAFGVCSNIVGMTLPFVGSKRGNTNSRDALFGYVFGTPRFTSPDRPADYKSTRQLYGKSSSATFYIPNSLKSVRITDETVIGYGAFYNCLGLSSVSINGDVTSIGDYAFYGCTGLIQMSLPSSVTVIGESAFYGCSRLADIYYQSVSAPVVGGSAFSGCYWDMVIHVPETWQGRSPMLGGIYLDKAGGGAPSNPATVNVVVSNVIVQYVFNSIQSQFAIPASSDVGFVNIIAEVKGGCVAVPATWAENYPSFAAKYGSDFTKALTMKSGKKDGVGNEMLVWQDYVAGTDPTDEKDVFTASITIVDGKVTISYTPELDNARKKMRKYTTWGKTSLMDTDWTEVQEGREAEYNFFKVSVEMR